MVTIKDIAKAAGVSHTTVSRALNNSSLIKNETKRKIQEIAKELDYVPNYSAKGLVNQKKYLIGLFFSSMRKGTSSSFLADSISGIHEALDVNYSLSVESIDTVVLSELNLQRYDGVLVMSQSDEDQHFIDYLREKKCPFVVVNRHIEDPDIPNVVADDAAGVTEAIDYGISLGHRKIAYIGGKENFRSTNERKKGVLSSLKKAGLPINDAFFLTGDYTLESGLHNMNQLLSLPELPTLVFCGNDDTAIGALRAIRIAGLHVPQTISLIGFDDSPVVSYLNPPLTTVHKPLKQMCEQATFLLLSLIGGESVDQKKIQLSTTLKIRESVKTVMENKNKRI
ncbi:MULTISPECIES: LacI family DNA-binding transcriptional regulator [unclassified Enterococcus]|uniref:LacI family DNA-binding transcriptional regulator n=1 Tax=unclassified Enterococcus TaxID=2608891 RepID=UPI0013EE260D|nr:MULTISPECIES: LacI family DNA-binding transcriptional regulator [unclassified Enterococcus]